jgi:hypothetical protein
VPLRQAAALVVVGQLTFLVSGAFHPDHSHANDHRAAFAEYAASDRWIPVHIGQFVGVALLLAGVLALADALDPRRGAASAVACYTRATAVATVAAYGVLQAVDGVALKHAVDAWVRAPADQEAAAFRAAETVRWLEWGTRSFEQFLHGTCLLLLGGLIVMTVRLPRRSGYLVGAAGVAYLAQGYIISQEGFSMRGGVPGLVALVSTTAWIADVARRSVTRPAWARVPLERALRGPR